MHSDCLLTYRADTTSTANTANVATFMFDVGQTFSLPKSDHPPALFWAIIIKNPLVNIAVPVLYIPTYVLYWVVRT